MTVIYIDTLFLLNAVIDYLLLLAAAKVAGEPLHRLRFAAGGFLGGLYAAAIFLPGFSFLSHPLCRIAAAAVMILAAFGNSKRLLRQSLIFFALTCAFAGGILAISLLGGEGLSLGRGVIYSNMDLKVVLLSAAACYMILTLLFRKWGKHSTAAGEIISVTIHFDQLEIPVKALIDTGNTLTDPVSGCPVMVAEGEYIEQFFPPEQRLTKGELEDPVDAARLLKERGMEQRLRLLPFRSVGIEKGLLLALRTDKVLADGRNWTRMLVALSPTPVSEGGSYQALIGSID